MIYFTYIPHKNVHFLGVALVNKHSGIGYHIVGLVRFLTFLYGFFFVSAIYFTWHVTCLVVNMSGMFYLPLPQLGFNVRRNKDFLLCSKIDSTTLIGSYVLISQSTYCYSLSLVPFLFQFIYFFLFLISCKLCCFNAAGFVVLCVVDIVMLLPVLCQARHIDDVCSFLLNPFNYCCCSWLLSVVH